ncbi:MAG TPA: hypothetical protein VFA63_17135 [Pseudonocardiaceae bacterium]|nr:hypothetical protein [Pseudonocardiaceae bacterium]
METAIQWVSARYGRPDDVLVSLPDTKSPLGIDDALSGLRVTKVKARASHLCYEGWGAGSPYLDGVVQVELGPVVLAVGTVSFIAEVLEFLGAPVDEWWAQ